LRQRHRSAGTLTSLNIITGSAARDPHPLVTLVLGRTVKKARLERCEHSLRTSQPYHPCLLGVHMHRFWASELSSGPVRGDT
jgi:hypothetical protein